MCVSEILIGFVFAHAPKASEQMTEGGLPLGVTFRPTNDELVSYYLAHKVAGVSEQFYAGIVHDFDVFGEQEPWEIWQIFGDSIFKDPVAGHEDLYFFTKLKKSYPKGKSNYRKVGSGTWKGQNTGTQVRSDSDENVVTGSKKRFHYENGNRGEQENGVSWIMFQYSISPTTHSSDYVLCQIHKKYPSPSKLHDHGDHEIEKKKRKLCRDDHLGFGQVEQQSQCQYQQPLPSSTTMAMESSSTVANPHEQQSIIHGVPHYINLEEEVLPGCDQQQYQVVNHDGGLGHNNIFVDHQPLRSPPTISVDDYEQENIILPVSDDIHHVEEEPKQQQQQDFDWMSYLDELLDFNDDKEQDHNQPLSKCLSSLDLPEIF